MTRHTVTGRRCSFAASRSSGHAESASIPLQEPTERRRRLVYVKPRLRAQSSSPSCSPRSGDGATALGPRLRPSVAASLNSGADSSCKRAPQPPRCGRPPSGSRSGRIEQRGRHDSRDRRCARGPARPFGAHRQGCLSRPRIGYRSGRRRRTSPRRNRAWRSTGSALVIEPEGPSRRPGWRVPSPGGRPRDVVRQQSA